MEGIKKYDLLQQVSHHPTLIACHCEGKGWKLWAESNIRTKFWGTSIKVDPAGTINLEFEDGEIFRWSKVWYIELVIHKNTQRSKNTEKSQKIENHKNRVICSVDIYNLARIHRF